MPVLLLELNEVNFEQVQAYGARLPNLTRLIADHGIAPTTSEQRYEDLEPWIQWVTAHTGLSLADHGVERLGDIVGVELDQIWEVLERQGIRVGAVSPMNAVDRCRAAGFFVPDPWTPTSVTGPPTLRRLYAPIQQAVNDNARARVTASSMAQLAVGLVRYASVGQYTGYAADLAGAAMGRPWRKAMLLDRLLADIFIAESRRYRPGFASLFLNAGAHIQHHYLFNSATYRGAFRNPGWYVTATQDPVREVYELYDRIVGDLRRAFPLARLMIATGLHQNAYSAVTLYWRLKDHAAFLRDADVPFARVEPRMSRDFVLLCDDAAQATVAETRLRAIVSDDGRPLFSVDNRGGSLFVMLTWPDDIPPDFVYRVAGVARSGLRNEVSFVAIKNGEHDGKGYFIDTGTVLGEADCFPLKDLPIRIAAACGVDWPGQPARIRSAADVPA